MRVFSGKKLSRASRLPACGIRARELSPATGGSAAPLGPTRCSRKRELTGPRPHGQGSVSRSGTYVQLWSEPLFTLTMKSPWPSAGSPTGGDYSRGSTEIRQASGTAGKPARVGWCSLPQRAFGRIAKELKSFYGKRPGKAHEPGGGFWGPLGALRCRRHPSCRRAGSDRTRTGGPLLSQRPSWQNGIICCESFSE